MRHRRVSGADLHAGRTAVDQEARYALLRPLVRLLFSRRREDDDEVGDVGVAYEVLGAVDDPVVADSTCEALHATQVRPGAGLRHGESVDLVAADAGDQVARLLFFCTGAQDLGWTPPE